MLLLLVSSETVRPPSQVYGESLMLVPLSSLKTLLLMVAPLPEPPGGSELLKLTESLVLARCVTRPVTEPEDPLRIVKRASVKVPAPVVARSPHATSIVLLVKTALLG